MKVKELMSHANLLSGQKTILHDYSTKKVFTANLQCFGMDSCEVDRILKLKVNTFRTSDKGLEIFAE